MRHRWSQLLYDMRARAGFLLRSPAGASGVQYAIILGAIVVFAIGGLVAFGANVTGMLERTGRQVDGTENPLSFFVDENAAPKPTASLALSPALVSFGESATVTWSSTHASTAALSYTLADTCERRSTLGAGPHDLGWSTTSGSGSVGWAPDLVGCTFTVTFTATGSGGQAQTAKTTSFEAVDSTPETLVFADHQGAEPGALVESPQTVVTGINAETTVSVSDPDAGVALGGSTNFASSQVVAPGGTVKLRATAPSSFAAERIVAYSAGTMTGSWRIETRARDTVPALIAFANQTAVPSGSTVTSEERAAAGFDGPITIGADNALVSVDGGAFVTTAALQTGQSIALQLVAPAYGATTEVDLKSLTAPDGSVQSVAFGSWSVTAAEQDVTPDDFLIANVTDAERSTVIPSSPILVTGFDGSIPIAATNGAAVSVEGGAFLASTTISANQSFVVHNTSSANWLTDATTTVSVGSVEKLWTVRSRAQDTQPAAYAFQTAPPQNPGFSVDRATTQPLAGFDGPLTVTASNGAQISKNGADFFATGGLTVNPGDSLWVRLTASTDDDDTPGTTQTNVAVGGASAIFGVTTKDSIPSGLAFTPLPQQNPGATVTSNVAALTNFNGPLTLTVSSAASSAKFRINGDAGGLWTNATAGGVTAQINAGDRLELQLTVAAGNSTITTSVARLSGAAPTLASWSVTGVSKLVYATPTTGTSFVVPAGVTSITVKGWGGGGGGATNSRIETAYKGEGGNGGGGGYATATIPVTPGETLTIKVGGAGAFGQSNHPTNGGRGGGGGGYTGLFRGATPLLIAGGGGGGGTGYAHVWGGDGGAGGGTVGLNAPDIDGATWGASGYGIARGGKGGTQSAGGAAGTPAGYTIATAGSSLTGGRGGYATSATGGAGGTNGGGIGGYGTLAGGGGGAGGGYFGGGGGSITTGSAHAAGGGGGSSFGGSTTAGSGQNVGNAGDADYQGNAGRGGTGVANVPNSGMQPTSGNPGLLVIRY